MECFRGLRPENRGCDCKERKNILKHYVITCTISKVTWEKVKKTKRSVIIWKF